MEKIAGDGSTPVAPAKEDPALTTPAVMAAEVEEAPVVTAPQVMATQDPAVSEPAAPPSPQEPAPASGVTRPLPVPVHGLAPLRGKPMQAFTAAMARNGGIQIPIDLALPLRPVMVWGPASKSASPEPETERAAPPARPIPIPEKSDRADTKPRRSEVRVLPVQVQGAGQAGSGQEASSYRIEPPRSEGARSEGARSEGTKQEATKPEATKNEAGKPEQVKSEPKKAEAVKETPAAGRPKGSQASAKPADSKPAEPKSANMKPGTAARPDPKQPEPASKAPARNSVPRGLLPRPKSRWTFWDCPNSPSSRRKRSGANCRERHESASSPRYWHWSSAGSCSLRADLVRPNPSSPRRPSRCWWKSRRWGTPRAGSRIGSPTAKGPSRAAMWMFYADR